MRGNARVDAARKAVNTSEKYRFIVVDSCSEQ
jgi:hypothetical protein